MRLKAMSIGMLALATIAAAEMPPCVGDRHDNCQPVTCTGDDDGFVYDFSQSCEAFLNGIFLTATAHCGDICQAACRNDCNVTCPACPSYEPPTPTPAPMYRPCRMNKDGQPDCPAPRLPHRVLVPFNQ